MTTLSTLVVKLVGETGPFVTAVQDAAKTAKKAGGDIADGLGGALASIGKVAAGLAVAGIAAVGTGLTIAVKEAADAEKNLAQLDSVLKSTGGAAGVTRDSILELASSLQRTTTFSDDEVIAADSLLLTFTRIGKEVFPDATRAVLDMSIALGQDTKSSAIQLGKALNDPIKGVTALSKAGVSFTAEQKKLIKSLVESGDVMGAQKIILQELQTEFGGSAEAAGKTLSGSLTILKNAGLDILETIGTALLPMLTQLAQGLRDALDNPAVQAGIQAIMAAISRFVSEVLPQIIAGLQGVIAWIQTNWPAVQAVITDVFERARAIIEPIVNAIRGVVEGVFGAIQTFIGSHGEEMEQTIGGVWGTIRSIIEGVVGIIGTVITSAFGGIRDFINEHGAQIQLIIETVWTAIKNVVETTLGAINGIIGAIMDVLQGNWSGAWEKIKGVVTTIWNGIRAAIDLALNAIKSIITLAWNSIRSGVESAWNSIRAAIEGAWQKVIDFLNGLWDTLVNIGRNIIEGIAAGIRNAASAIWNALKNAVEGAWQKIKDLLGISSPSAVYAAIGAQMMAGLALGIERGAYQPRMALEAVSGSLMQDVTAAQLTMNQQTYSFGAGAIVINATERVDARALAQLVLDEAAARADTRRRMK